MLVRGPTKMSAQCVASSLLFHYFFLCCHLQQLSRRSSLPANRTANARTVHPSPRLAHSGGLIAGARLYSRLPAPPPPLQPSFGSPALLRPALRAL